MKANEVRKLSAEELQSKLVDLKRTCSTSAFSTPPTSWTTPSASLK